MFKPAAIIYCSALIFLAGCATSPNEPLPPDWSGTNEVRVAQNPPSLKPIPPVANASLSSGSFSNSSNLPPVTNSLKPRVPEVFTWTSLNRWAAEHKIGSLRRLTGGPTTRFCLDATNGLLVLEIGSREALWRGMQFHLGYPPEIIDNQVFIHGVDLQKNLVPLMLDDAPAFGTNRVIVIDPGHGGINAGTISVLDRRPEKEFTLDWACRLKPLLEQEGWQVFLTRTNDVDVALSNRVAVAECHHAEVFISLHFNSAAPDKKESGLETYCLTPVGMPSTLTRGFADPLTENLPNNNFDAQNLQLAVLIQKALLHASGEEDRGVRRARFIGVLRGQKRPAILIEGGYLSNPQEAAKIEAPEFRQKLAEAVANTLK